MTGNSLFRSRQHQHCVLLFASVIVILSTLAGCGPSTEELEAVDYAPLPEGDWKVSTPEEQGLDPMLLARLYHEAAELETLYGLLVIKNGHLIAEKYFNEGSIDQVSGRQSSTKSFTSALVGIALEQGCIQSLDQKMMEFFPEFAGRDQGSTEGADHDPASAADAGRISRRGIHRGLLFEIMFFQGNWSFCRTWSTFLSPAIRGAKFHYSNLTSHLLGRHCGPGVRARIWSRFAQQHLFSPMDAECPAGRSTTTATTGALARSM